MFIDGLSRISAIYDWQGAGKLDFNRDWKLFRGRKRGAWLACQDQPLGEGLSRQGLRIDARILSSLASQHNFSGALFGLLTRAFSLLTAIMAHRSLLSTVLLSLLLLPFSLALKFDLAAHTGHNSKYERCIRNFVGKDTLVLVTAIVDGQKGDGQMVNMHVSLPKTTRPGGRLLLI